MIIIEDLRVAVILGVLAAMGLMILACISDPKPQCPAGAEAKYIRSTWYCVVPEVN